MSFIFGSEGNSGFPLPWGWWRPCSQGRERSPAPGGWNSASGKEGMRRKLINASRSLWKGSNSSSLCQGSSAFHPSQQEFLPVGPFLEHPPPGNHPKLSGGKPASDSSKEAVPCDFFYLAGNCVLLDSPEIPPRNSPEPFPL